MRVSATFVALVLLALACQPAALRTTVRRDPASALEPPTEALVVLVPGATGSMLRDAGGRVRWGLGRNLLHPHDGGYGLVRPVADRDDAARLDAFALIGTIRLAGILRKPVYGPLVRWLEAAGYRRAGRQGPRAVDSLLLFPWDWRLSHASAAARLEEALEAARQARGEDVLPVALVCQSSGAHVCRWFAKYGGATLEEAEAGGARPPPSVALRTMVLIGSSNGGSLRILRELDRGRRYVPALGRKWQPETLFTFPALYEDLPAYRSDLFVDEGGAALDVDLYDAASWRRFGWSALSTAARRRIDRADARLLFGSEEERLEYLRWALGRARRFQRALAADVGWVRAPRYHLIQGRSDPATPERAVLATDAARDRRRLLFTGDPAVDRDPRLRALTSATGDGHATLASQLWLGAEETRALRGPPVHVPGAHFELILSREARAALLHALAN